MSGQLLSDEVQLGFALEAFGWAHMMGVGWTTTTLLYLKNAGISTLADLSTGCKDQTINLDLELFDTPKEYFLAASTLKSLEAFLPGPMGFRTFRLAQRIATKVEKGHAETEYVHRPENGKKGDEEFHMPVGDTWVVNVDCAGFVRNALKHVTKNPLVMSLSDRDFMRAKDFYEFFLTIPYTVMDKQEIPDGARIMKWRIVKDLRMVIPGDIIVYRPKGNAAGGAAFTTNDRKDINHVLKAVKTAQIWNKIRATGTLVTRNVGKDPEVRAWIASVKAKLNSVGIVRVKDLYNSLSSGTLNEKLIAQGFNPMSEGTLAMMKECCETTAQNTGHIVFASGPAMHKGDGVYRIRVVHSTKHGKKDENGVAHQGVEEYYRKFSLKEDENGKPYWTREMTQAKNALTEVQPEQTDDEGEIPNDDMEEEEGEETANEEDSTNNTDDNNGNKGGDDLSGQLDVQVIAARMCF